MPYAHYDRISTSPIAGGIEISAGDYATALAGMTNTSAPLQVSITGGALGLAPPSYPIQLDLTLAAATTLPEISPGRTPVNTGICRHPSGSGWLIGDADAGATAPRDAGVIHYSDEWVMLGRFRWVSYGFSGSVWTSQGVDADPRDGTFWGTLTFTNTIVQIDASTGVLLRQIALDHTPNGLAIIPEVDQIVTFDSGGLLRRIAISDGALVSGPFSIQGTEGSPDHLHYLGGGKALVTFDQSSGPGVIYAIDISTGSPTCERRINPSGATAIEGACLHNNRLYLCNDAGFHGGGLNQILEYDVAGLFF